MKSSIYISSEKIEVLGYTKTGGRIAVKTFITSPLREGTVINGKITDPAHLVERLTSLHKKNPGLFAESELTVDGSSVLVKRMTVPKLNRDKYYQLVNNEFTETAGNLEELVCDYHMLTKANGHPSDILACAAEKSQVESYVTTFKDAGIKLGAIRVGIQSILDYVASRQDMKSSTFVLNIIDGVAMLSMLFDKGRNVFMSRTRLYSDEREQFLQNILNNLSGIIQFNKSEKFDDITRSYYLGLSGNDIKILETLNPYPGIRIESPDIFAGSANPEKINADVHFVFLNALMGEKSIDLIKSCKYLEKLKKKQRPKNLMIPVIIGLAAILLIPIAGFLIKLADMGKVIDDLNGYINDESIIAKSEEIDKISERTAYYNSVYNQLKGKTDAEEGKALVTPELLDLIMVNYTDIVEVTQIEFNETSGTIRAGCKSATENDSAQYVEMLKRSMMISEIKYTGYSYGSDGEYNFSIDIRLAVKETDE